MAGERPHQNGNDGRRNTSTATELGGACMLGEKPGSTEPATTQGLLHQSPFIDNLLPQHARMLRDSAISDEVARARGYESVATKARLKRLGFTDRQCSVPSLLVPIHNVHGEISLYQARPNCPRIGKGGRPVKYETPGGSRMVLDVPPGARERLRDPGVPLVITEGSKKADSAVSRGLCCIGVLGVWNWRGTNDHGGKTALSDWELIALNGRVVYLVFDSDVMTKPQVHAALARLKAFLESRGANVLIIYLPSGDGGRKTGLDDYLAAGHSVDNLLSHAASDLKALPDDTTLETGGQYVEGPDGIVWRKQVPDGTATPVRLTNFTARIVSNVKRDDGAEVERQFEIEAALAGKIERFSIRADEYGKMNWILERLGGGAIVEPGPALRDRARAAIQELSGEISERTVYTHVGWQESGGKSVYLHAGGAIGPCGAVPDIWVDPPDSLAGFHLPPPPLGDALHKAVTASIGLLEVAPDEITFPILCSIYRPPLGVCDMSVHLAGGTGVGKTALALLAQQHYAPRVGETGAPASWSSTGNSLEALAFSAKNALLLVDDFAPTGTQYDIQRLHRDADRVLRAQANRSARGRMGRDGSLRPTKPPRGLILSTGEDVPRGQSLRARIAVVELREGQIDWPRMTDVQEAGRQGLFAAAMSAFVQWLAGRVGRVQKQLHKEIADLRSYMVDAMNHRRTPTNFANLMLGLRYFLWFACASEVMTESIAHDYWHRGWAAMLRLADRQDSQQSENNPVHRFLDLISSAMSSGAAHIACMQGNKPKIHASAYGWRSDPRGQNFELQPQGRRIGWTDAENIYLDADASFRAAREMAGHSDSGIMVGQQTLWRRLNEAGLLRTVDQNRKTLKIRHTVEGTRHTVLHLAAEAVLSANPTNPTTGSRGSGHASKCPPLWAPTADQRRDCANPSTTNHADAPFEEVKL